MKTEINYINFLIMQNLKSHCKIEKHFTNIEEKT